MFIILDGSKVLTAILNTDIIVALKMSKTEEFSTGHHVRQINHISVHAKAVDVFVKNLNFLFAHTFVECLTLHMSRTGFPVCQFSKLKPPKFTPEFPDRICYSSPQCEKTSPLAQHSVPTG